MRLSALQTRTAVEHETGIPMKTDDNHHVHEGLLSVGKNVGHGKSAKEGECIT